MSDTLDYATLKKGGFMRQRQKNRFSLRLHVVGGHLSTDDLRAISKVADEFGDGRVHLTARQGVEIPFVKLEDVEAIRERLAEHGLRPGVCGPRVRTVTACQGNMVCPSASIDAQSLARTLDERYYGVELPHKFKFGVTGCANNCLKAEENDVGIKGALSVEWVKDSCISCGICVKACREDAVELTDDGSIVVSYDKCTSCGRCAKACPTDAWNTEPGWAVFFGGQFGSRLIQGTSSVPVVHDEDQLLRVCDAAVEYFQEHGRAGERFGRLLQREGRKSFDQKIKEAYHG